MSLIGNIFSQFLSLLSNVVNKHLSQFLSYKLQL